MNHANSSECNSLEVKDQAPTALTIFFTAHKDWSVDMRDGLLYCGAFTHRKSRKQKHSLEVLIVLPAISVMFMCALL